MRLLATSLLCAAVLLGGCRTKSSDPAAMAPTTTLPPATTAVTQPTATTLNLSAPPTDAQLQDPAYWNAVLAKLNRVAGEAFRSAVRSRAVEPSAVEALRQVYGPVLFEDEHEVLAEVAAGKGNGVLMPPGDAVADVTSIVKTDPRCAALTATLDYGKVNPTVGTSRVAMKLLRRQSTEAADANPTPWKIEELYVISSPEEVNRLCTG